MLSPADIRRLSDKDIAKELEKARLLIFKHRMGTKTGHFKDTHVIGELKKYVARLMTVINSRKHLEVEVGETEADAKKKVDALHATMEKRQEIKTKKRTPAAKKEKAEATEEVTTPNV